MSETCGTFEHGADFGVFGRGPDPASAFREAARAMFALMTDPDAVQPLLREALSRGEIREFAVVVPALSELYREVAA